MSFYSCLYPVFSASTVRRRYSGIRHSTVPRSIRTRLSELQCPCRVLLKRLSTQPCRLPTSSHPPLRRAQRVEPSWLLIGKRATVMLHSEACIRFGSPSVMNSVTTVNFPGGAASINTAFLFQTRECRFPAGMTRSAFPWFESYQATSARL
jgi:hypothetical protein